MNTRDEIAAALTLDGITNVTGLYRQSLRPGDGFVRLGVRTRDASGFGYMQAWEVWIAVPGDLAAAETWLDTNLDQITEAASTVLVVTTITPSELVLGASTANGIVVAGSIPA
jgi:hypothetical protein